MTDKLLEIIETISTSNIREPGWHDLDEIQQNATELQLLSRNGILYRLKQRVIRGILETKIVFDPERSRHIKVWRMVEKEDESIS